MRIPLFALVAALSASACFARSVGINAPVTVLPGQTVQTSIMVSDDVTGIAGGSINISAENEPEYLTITTEAGAFLAEAFRGDPIPPHGVSFVFLSHDMNGPGELLKVKVTAAAKEPKVDQVLPLHISGVLKPAQGTDPLPGVEFQDSSAILLGGVIGDADGDGKVTVKDVTKLLKTVLGLDTMTAAQRYYADVYPATGTGTLHGGDGKISVADATYVLKAVAGLLTLPAPKQ
ncbi:MAG TPA: dockerin type I repeat-containing protein [Armatimonadota bacterium]